MRQGGGILTGKDNKAEGESLNVFGWVSPIACGVGGGGGECAQAKWEKAFQLSLFYSSPHSLPTRG